MATRHRLPPPEKSKIPLQTLLPPPKLIKTPPKKHQQNKFNQIPIPSPIPLIRTPSQNTTTSTTSLPNPPLRHILSLKGIPNTRLSYCLNFLTYLKELPLVKWDSRGNLEAPFEGFNIIDFIDDSSKNKGDIPKPTLTQYINFIKSVNIDPAYILNKNLKLGLISSSQGGTVLSKWRSWV